LKNRISSAFGVIILLFSFLSVFGNQDSLVITIPNKQVSVTFPQEPYRTVENFFLPTGTKEVVGWQHVERGGAEYQFSYFTTDFVKSSDLDKTIAQWINQTGLKNQAQLVSKKKSKSGETIITKVEYKTFNNHKLMAYFFYSRQTLCRISVLSPPFMDNLSNENMFFESINFPKTTSPTKTSSPTTDKGTVKWEVAVSSDFEVLFPQVPAAVNYHITNNNSSTNLYNYVVENASGISYLLSHFSNPKLNQSEIDKLLTERINSLKRSKILYTLQLNFFKYPCTEYFFKDKHYYYKYRIFKKDNSYFQLLIKSDKKAISSWENEYFFENFSLF
jgi:hypothetical protein